MNTETSAIFWLLLNLASIVTLSFFSMMEMACVSFNKIRLQYYVSKNNKRAIILNNLLKDPAKLFGATLIGVNVALIFGSEFARQFHSAIGLSPDLAPISQVIIVVIFGELAPMFAARRYAEHMTLLGIPLLSGFAAIMTPILWLLTGVTRVTQYFIGGKADEHTNIFLTQEEIQKLLEEQPEETGQAASSEFNVIVSNIFNLRSKLAYQVMTPIEQIKTIPSNCSIGNLRQILAKNPHVGFLPLYHRKWNNIVGIAMPRDLLREPDNHQVRNHVKAPTFVPNNTEIIQILKQFRRNNQNVAVVLDDKGQGVGILTLEDIMEAVFGKTLLEAEERPKNFRQVSFIDKTIPGKMEIAEFNKTYHASLPCKGHETFEDVLIESMGHQPVVGDVLYLQPFEIKVKEATLLEIKSVTVRTKI